MHTLEFNDDAHKFISQLLAVWTGPGVYRIEKLDDLAKPAAVLPIPQSPDPRHRIYHDPILIALLLKGGRAHVNELKPVILEMVRSELTDRELNQKKSNRPFWWYDCQIERYEMLGDTIQDRTSVGYWSLTPKGLEEAKQARVRWKNFH